MALAFCCGTGEGHQRYPELAHQILRIHGLSNWDKGTTLNVGVVPAARGPTLSLPRPRLWSICGRRANWIG
ncbi:MAG: hypothetical protein R2856_22090 [Caldilineaceae bacterium]